MAPCERRILVRLTLIDPVCASRGDMLGRLSLEVHLRAGNEEDSDNW